MGSISCWWKKCYCMIEILHAVKEKKEIIFNNNKKKILLIPITKSPLLLSWFAPFYTSSTFLSVAVIHVKYLQLNCYCSLLSLSSIRSTCKKMSFQNHFAGLFYLFCCFFWPQMCLVPCSHSCFFTHLPQVIITF